MAGPRRLFALDHNFPEPVLSAFADLLPMVELVAVRAVDSEWAELDDWELLLALHRHERPWDGLITNDENMLSLPKEMTVLSQTRLTLVVAKGEGHNPIRAVGAVLCHLPHICRQSAPDQAQVWNLRVAQKNHEDAHEFLEKDRAEESYDRGQHSPAKSRPCSPTSKTFKAISDGSQLVQKLPYFGVSVFRE